MLDLPRLDLRLQPLLLSALLASVSVFGLGACTRGIRPNPEQPLAVAVKTVVADIATQLGQGKRVLVIDPFLDAKTGQQNRACERAQSGSRRTCRKTSRAYR